MGPIYLIPYKYQDIKIGTERVGPLAADAGVHTSCNYITIAIGSKDTKKRTLSVTIAKVDARIKRHK